jgi:DNA-binding PadR family transcriptional regulator
MSPRFFRHGELHLVILAIVSTTPMHGYDLMAELARLFGPRYRPSPGSVYPAVEALSAEGLLDATDVDGRKVYSVTATGTDALVTRQAALTALEARTGVRLAHRSRVDTALAHFEATVRGVAGRLDPDTLEHLLEAAAETITSAPHQRPHREEP